MIGLTALVVGVLFATSVYLILSKNMQLVSLGFVALTTAANLMVLAASGLPEDAVPPLIGEQESGPYADPLPQAFILTAIVIGLGNTAFLIALAGRTHRETGSDEVEGAEWE